MVILTSLSPSYCTEDTSKASPEQQAKNKFDAGKFFYDQGNYTGAQDPFKEAIKQYPNSVESNWYLVDCMVVKDVAPDAFNQTIEFYNEQIGINANPFSDYRSGLYFGLGLCYFMKGATYKVDDSTIEGLKNKVWFEIDDRVIGKLKNKLSGDKLKMIKPLKGRKFSKDELLSTLKNLKFKESDMKTVKALSLNSLSASKLLSLGPIKYKEFTKEEEFSDIIKAIGFKDYETTLIKSYALKFDQKNKEKIIEYFNLSLSENTDNECAKAIMDIKNTHKQDLGRIEKPLETKKQKFLKIASIAGIVIFLLIIIGPVRNYIKSRQPKFTGLIFMFNPEGEKIEDQMLEKYRRVNNTTISVGSDPKNGIVIPSAKPFHAILKAEKLVYQYRVNIAPQKDAKLFLIAKEKDQKGNETGVSFTVEFFGGLLYDSDVLKFGSYFMQYINSNVPKRTQEEVLQMLTALHPTAMKEKPHEEQKPVETRQEEKKEISRDKTEVSSVDYEDKEKLLKEKLLSRRHEDSDDEAIDLGAPAFSGAILFSQDKEKEIKDAIARAKAKLQQSRGQEEEEKTSVVEEEEEEYEQYMSIVGVTSVQADELTGIKVYEEYDDEEYDDEEYDDEEYDDEEYDDEIVVEEKVSVPAEEKTVALISQEVPGKKESIKDAIEKVKIRMKLSREDNETGKEKKNEDKYESKEKKYEEVIKPDEHEEEMLAVGIGFDDFEEEETFAIGMSGYDDEDEETSESDLDDEKDDKDKKIKIKEKPEEGKTIKEEPDREEKERVKLKKVIKKIPEELPEEKEDEIAFVKKAKTVSEGISQEKKKIKKKITKVKTSSASIEDKVKAIEESMQKSMEEKFIKINKDKVKKVVKKKISSGK
jgi:tetratricopeptide (TPR) repeat protein